MEHEEVLMVPPENGLDLRRQFIHMCCFRATDEINQFLNEHQDEYIFEGKEEAFMYACAFGRIDTAKLIRNLNSGEPINIHARDELAFRHACEHGHIEVADWLLRVSEEEGHPINIHADNDYAFRHACEHGRLHIAEWLYKLGLTIDGGNHPVDIHAINDYALYHARRNNHAHVVGWLTEISTNKTILGWLCIVM